MKQLLFAILLVALGEKIGHDGMARQCTAVQVNTESKDDRTAVQIRQDMDRGN